jgi:hypothetical protein
VRQDDSQLPYLLRPSRNFRHNNPHRAGRRRAVAYRSIRASRTSSSYPSSARARTIL